MNTLNEEEKQELFELLKEQTEKLQNLTKHYEGSIEALTNAGTDPEEQRTQFQSCIDSNNKRIHLLNNIIIKLDLA